MKGVKEGDGGGTRGTLVHRLGGALGLAYAMYDRGEPMRDVRAQLREARAIRFLLEGKDGLSPWPT